MSNHPTTAVAAAAIDNADAKQLWAAFAQALQQAGNLILDDPQLDSERLGAEAIRYLMRVLNVSMDVGVEIVDPAYPRLIRLYDTYRNMANCNPDCIYLYARISPEYTYRIAGNRGSALMFEVATMDADMLAYPAGKWLQTIADFAADPDGSIEITLSADAHTKNWVPLDQTARWIYVRQYFYDWNTEQPAQLTIERIGAAFPAPPPAPAGMASDIAQLTKWLPGWYHGLAENLAGKFYAGPEDQLVFSGASAGFSGIAYGRGHFTCGPDQAIIIEFQPPEGSLYWSIHIGSHHWEALDWDLRQCSLNGHQAILDSDGKFRGVIALQDPGVANWLDPAGHERGLICCRVVRAKSAPEVRLYKIAVADLQLFLPAGAVFISPAQRRETVRQRMLGVQRRYRE